MPLINDEPFKPVPLPQVALDDEVFYHPLTNEIFTTHGDFFERSIFCQSLIWTCSVTGKSGLTFQEALESEAGILIHETPEPPKKRRKRRKNNSLSQDGDSCVDSNNKSKSKGISKGGRKKVKIEDTEKQQQDKEQSLDHQHNIDPAETSIQSGSNISLDNNKDSQQPQDSSTPIKKKKKKYPYDPKKYSMPVPDGFDPDLLTPSGKIDGRKLKSKKNQKLAEELFAKAPYTPPASKRGKKPSSSTNNFEEKKQVVKSQEELARERELEAKRKKEAAALAKQLERQKREEERKKAAAYLQDWDKKCEDLERDDLKLLPQPTLIDCEIPQHLFGDALFIMEAFHNFHDLYNLQEVLSPEGITFDTLEEMLLEKNEDGPLGTIVMYLLDTIIELQPTGDGYGVIEESRAATAALTNKSTDQVSKDDEDTILETTTKVNHHEANGICEDGEAEEDEADKYVDMNDMIGSAIRAAQDVRNSLTIPIAQMELNEQTITEVLRLHLLQSGSFPKGRTIYNGWYSSREDPGLWLCMQEPDLIKKLADTTIHYLDIEEKIKILHTLIYQLITFIKTRFYIEAASEQLTELRKSYRKDAADFGKWDRENCVKKMQAPKKKDQDASISDKLTNSKLYHNGTGIVHDESDHEDGLESGDMHTTLKSCLKSETNGDSNHLSTTTKKKLTFKSKDGAINSEEQTLDADHSLSGQENGKEISLDAEEQTFEDQDRAYQQNVVDYEDYQRERTYRLEKLNEMHLEFRASLRNVQHIYGLHPVGRDRAYRRYWWFQTLPGLFVEQDDENVGRCLDEPTPLESKYKKLFNKDNPLRNMDESVPIELDEFNQCTGDESTCAVHGVKRPIGPRWSFYHTPEQIDSLTEALNKRGTRESELLDTLMTEKSLIKQWIADCPYYKLNKQLMEASGFTRARRVKTRGNKRKLKTFD